MARVFIGRYLVVWNVSVYMIPVEFILQVFFFTDKILSFKMRTLSLCQRGALDVIKYCVVILLKVTFFVG